MFWGSSLTAVLLRKSYLKWFIVDLRHVKPSYLLSYHLTPSPLLQPKYQSHEYVIGSHLDSLSSELESLRVNPGWQSEDHPKRVSDGIWRR